MDDKIMRDFDEAAERASRAHDYMLGLLFAVPMIATAAAVAVRMTSERGHLSTTKERVDFVKEEIFRAGEDMKKSMPYATKAVDDVVSALYNGLSSVV